jgi:hypothetical protein
MTPDQRRVEINMSGIPVNGVGGLGLVATALLMTVVFPEAWWLVVSGALGGGVLAAVMILARRGHVPSGPSGNDPTILFRPEPEDATPVTRNRETHVSRDVAVART